MIAQRWRASDLLATLPPEWPSDLLPEIQAHVRRDARKVVVLDDDPTGTQTVHGVPVLTEWDVDALAAELSDPLPVVYILTNSRSLPLLQAQALNAEIGRRLVEADRRFSRGFVVISRSDSTLRGHFPGEVEALAESLGESIDAWLLIPFFQEGGRYTINDVHYVADGEWLVPAGDTEFARDPAFGYRASNLRQWIEEKTGGRTPAHTVASITIDDLRRGGPSRVAERLSSLTGGMFCVVNAASRRDLDVLVLAVLQAEADGRRFMYRTAASFVPARSGLAPRGLLAPSELRLEQSGGGLIVVGSHVPRTTRQLDALFTLPGCLHVEVSAGALLDDQVRQNQIASAVSQSDQALRARRDVVISTSRALATGRNAADSLTISRRVSEGMAAIVRGLAIRPRYIIAKGGITSSDLATKALHVRRAVVLGQILPGVPVWRLGAEARHPELAYIVFPGNVGTDRSLLEIVAALRE